MNIICWLKSIWRTLQTRVWIDGDIVSGHDLVEIEKHNNVSVLIGKCEICNHVHISWSERPLP